MAPSRGRGGRAARSRGDAPSQGSASLRSRATVAPANVYRSMLTEAEEAETREIRPLKRRRVATARQAAASLSHSEGSESERPASLQGPDKASASRKSPDRQTIEDSSQSNDSDLDFEDVNLDRPTEASEDIDNRIEDLSISVQQSAIAKQSTRMKRKPMSGPEKAHRFLVHKLHVLCLLGHCMYVNGRCNSSAVQQHLAPLLSERTRSYLDSNMSHSQFQQNRSFMDGLQQALDAFIAVFSVNASGLQKPHWNVEDAAVADTEPAGPMDKTDFIEAAETLTGSQDVGNQLFCALLRSAKIETRIVCSLQTLSFRTSPKMVTPRKSQKQVTFAIAPGEASSSHRTGFGDDSIRGTARTGKAPTVRRRPAPTGQPASEPAHSPVSQPMRKKFRKLSYPVFWVEAFNAAQQKWIAVDAMVTKSLNKPSKLEPPASYDLNDMLYTIAFESDGAARDVTRRYAKAYNAKTRQHRVEASGEYGMRWWKKVMHFFSRRPAALDRDQIEDAELAQKEAREGLPANIQDFKDHPYFALERHLKRHEVIHPRHEVGKVNAGTAAKPRMEAIFRRRDVLVCRSADKWYRLGRVVTKGEQPLKHVPTRNKRNATPDGTETSNDNARMTAVYSAAQTDIYVPPPVRRGRITKNIYGNLDVYVQSMIPAGGVHVRHDLAQKAAKLLKVDYADAVTGFSFKGRRGTAVIEGVVVPQQFQEAIWAVIDGFDQEMAEDEYRARSLEAMRMWRRFMTGLRIAERVKNYGDMADAEADFDKVSDPGVPTDDVVVPGGFILETAEDTPLPTAGNFSIQELAVPPRKAQASKRRAAEESDNGSLVSEDEFDQENNLLFGDSEGYDSPRGRGLESQPNLGTAGQPGGYMPEDAMADEASEGGGFSKDDPTQDAIEIGSAGELRRAGGGTPMKVGKLMLTGIAENNDSEPTNDNVDTGAKDRSNTQLQQTRDGSVVSSASEAVGEQDHRSLNATPPGDASDHGSLLSHDPDDDDAEPDWLASD